MRDWIAYVRTHLRLSDLTPEREAHIVREVAAQLEDFYREARARGADRAAADAHARRQIADWPQLAQDVLRAESGHRRPAVDRLMDRFEAAPQGSRFSIGLALAQAVRDARFAIRQLRQASGFTVVAVLTLALGIGASTAIFSVVNGVLLRPLPYADPSAIVRVHEIVPEYGRFSVAPANFFDWRQQSTTFARLAAYTPTSATFMDAEGPERVQGLAVSWEMIDLLGVPPALGSGFAAAHDQPDADSAVVVLSHGLWQRRFGGDAAIVGRSVSIDGKPVTVLGVMPREFYFPTRVPEFWRPLGLNVADASRGAHYLGVVARLKPGVELDMAAAEMRGIAEKLAREYPQASAKESAEVVPLHDHVVAAVRPALITLLCAVAGLVLIACANVANLLLVRASVRAKEVAIRIALGAGRARLVRQMLVESMVLAIAGGALGVLLGWTAIPWIQSMGQSSLPRVADVALDVRGLACALAASVATGLLFGLAPAWYAGRSTSGEALKDAGRSSRSAGGGWLRSGLLVAEVALSMVLLIGAALFLRSFVRLTHVDPGFDPAQVLAFQVALPDSQFSTPAQRIAFFDTLIAELRAVPQVREAATVQRLPLIGGYVLSFAIEGRAPAAPGEEPGANHRVVSPGYFAALRIPVRRGRVFTPQDSARSRMVAVVDEAFAARHFPNEDPIGRQLDIGNGTDGAYEIVGLVGNVRTGGLDAAPAPTMYVPFAQDVFSTMWVVVRTEDDPAGIAGVVRQVLRRIDPALPAYSIQPLTTVLSDSIADRRFSTSLLSLFALVALILAAVGIYGVAAYTVSLRTREIGLRMAVGAQRLDIIRLVLGGGLKLAATGVALGLAAAIGFAHIVESMLFEVPPRDAVSYVSTALVLLATAAVACCVPARRAMRVDPAVALER